MCNSLDYPLCYDGFFAYRLPGQQDITSMSGVCRNGIADNSFLIAPFLNPGDNIISISAESIVDLDAFNTIALKEDNIAETFPLNRCSTSMPEHRLWVSKIVELLENNEFNKTVACRLIASKESINGPETFRNLCIKFPNAFVFLFYTPQSGAWVGASPELLLEAGLSGLKTYSLAGTRIAGTALDWDRKNILEQEIVSNYIKDIFAQWEMAATVSLPTTRIAGNVEHLLSEISVTDISKEFDSNQKEFLNNFSPTPALCGLPKKESLNLISKNESFSRGFYGGFVGFRKNSRDFKLYVNIRSVHFNSEYWNMIVGGGITCNSNPEDEWKETESKSFGIINEIKTI